MKGLIRALLAGLAASLALSLAAQTAAPSVRLRGSIEKLEGSTMQFRERSGELYSLNMPAGLNITEVYPIELGAIQPGSFIGSAAMPGPNGSLVALEVHVFPEAQRGTGEGHRAFDLQPQSTMTNATVAELEATPSGRTLRLKYKDGEKTLTVPANAPVVTYRPGDASLLVVGSRINVVVEKRGETLTLTRVTAGRNGFVPPM
jgi:hypothetical protein